MNNILLGLQHIILASSAVLAAYFPAVANINPLPSPAPRPEIRTQNIITRSGSYSYSGQTLNYSVNIPKDGGEINGRFSGVCNGPIRGYFKGAPSYAVDDGKVQATCLILLNKKLSVTYIAHLDLKGGKAHIDWVGDIPYTPGKGSFTIEFEPVK